MKSIITILLTGILLVLSSSAFARPGCACPTGMICIPSDPEPPIYSRMISSQSIDPLYKNIAPLYISGAMYQLTLSDFSVSHYSRTSYDKCNYPSESIFHFTVYDMVLPVNGDYGQELIFSISGRSGRHRMSLTATCGEFRASYHDDTYFISKTLRTNQTCTSLSLSFLAFGDLDLSTLDINVIIAESF